MLIATRTLVCSILLLFLLGTASAALAVEDSNGMEEGSGSSLEEPPFSSTKKYVRVCNKTSNPDGGITYKSSCMDTSALSTKCPKSSPKTCWQAEKREWDSLEDCENAGGGSKTIYCPPPDGNQIAPNNVRVELAWTYRSDDLFGTSNAHLRTFAAETSDDHLHSFAVIYERRLDEYLSIELRAAVTDDEAVAVEPALLASLGLLRPSERVDPLESSYTADLKFFFTEGAGRVYLAGGVGLYDFERAGGELGLQLGLGYQRTLKDRLVLDLSARHLCAQPSNLNTGFTDLRVGFGWRF